VLGFGKALIVGPVININRRASPSKKRNELPRWVL
jgi:hypothetical protein